MPLFKLILLLCPLGLHLPQPLQKSLPSRTMVVADSHEKAGGGAIDFWAVTEFVGFQQLAGLS